MCDPLSLLAGSDSSDSEDEAAGQTTTEDADNRTSSSPTDKLPSPSTLFATVGKPSFLNDPQAKEINWDSFVKNNLGSDKYDIHITDDGGYAAIPPPTDEEKPVYNSLSAAITGTYNKEGAGQISAAPVRYTQPEQVDPKYRSVDTGYKEEAQTGNKRQADTEGTELSSKKAKTETFRQKEKRKRDLGQSSRGKSYVEEEKRLLRQQYATDEIMS